ncbi:DUF423 domain-containing protein [Spongiimicrobium sp. 3-5]|uniref:DUF423 domain-containing protein n=1 Tax=Spongiimicrobium sp. 3-5 TaxID=3332596 RepID=UPI0039804043
MNKTIFITGLLFGFLAILLGALGSHGLEGVIDAKAITTFKTGVNYQMYSALFLLVLGSVKQLPAQKKRGVYYLTTLGTVLFSFSIYFLATNEVTAFDFGVIALATPIGGILLLSAWLVLGYRVFQQFD